MKKNDILLLVAIIVLSALSLALLYIFIGGSGEVVVVTVDGEEYARLPLDTDTELMIVSERGTNRLVIKDGKAYISEASCPDKICVKHRRISYSGETIVCLPNGVSVKIEGSGGGVDAVS